MVDSMQYVITIQSRKKKADETILKPPKSEGDWSLHSWRIDGKKIAVVWQAPALPKAKRGSKRNRSSAPTATTKPS